jgi:hypothetical protein
VDTFLRRGPFSTAILHVERKRIKTGNTCPDFDRICPGCCRAEVVKDLMSADLSRTVRAPAG